MKRILAFSMIAFAALVSPACALTIDPIPGSLIYPTQPERKLKKAPSGSRLTHGFHHNGRDYRETYAILPNRDLKLLGRVRDRRK